MTNRHTQEIACQQLLLDDSSVFSIQHSLFPADAATGMTTRFMLERYLSHIRRATLSLIRPVELPDGIEFRLIGTSLSLISFLPPKPGDNSMLLRIRGGLLVQPRQCGRGELRFTLEPQARGMLAAIQLSEFYPLILGGSSPSLLRYWLYRLTQAAIHRQVTVRFLARLFREKSGYAPLVRIIPADLRSGRPL